MLKVFDLFSGCGGFRAAADKAGFKTVAYCKINKYAKKFYDSAFNTEGELYFNDAAKIIQGELPDFDLLTAGFPCQSFSIAGKRQGFKDARGTLFFEVARILKDKRPRYFILENVKGLLSHDSGKTFQTILKILSGIGIYSVEWALLNSKYFNVPQNRERVFIVGYPREFGIGKVFPLGENDKFCNETAENKKEIHNIASTLKARDYTSWGGNYIYQTEKIRRLTPLECFRLQGFSDEIFLKGSKDISDSQLYKLAGNSVTINVVYEIMKRIKELDKCVLT